MADGDVLHVVILAQHVLLAKRPGADWRALQDEFMDYKTSLGPYALEDAIAFIREEWPNAPFDERKARAFAAGPETLLIL